MSDRSCLFSTRQLKKPTERVSWSDELAAFAVWQHADVASVLSDCRFSANLTNIDQQSGQFPVEKMFVGLATSLPLFLGNASLALLLNPEQQTRYLQSPSASVSELLRYAGPAQVVYRLALQDTLVGDHHFQRGDRLGLLLAHANRDEQVFTDPEKLDLTRKTVPHLSFGKGMHACLGAPIIQAAGAILPYNILTRFPQMQVDISTIKWGGSQTIQGMVALPVCNTEPTETPDCGI